LGASDESSRGRDERLLFLVSLVCLVVAAVLAALWVFVEMEFGLVWFVLVAVGLGGVVLAVWAASTRHRRRLFTVTRNASGPSL
jgi:hypothetical protein